MRMGIMGIQPLTNVKQAPPVENESHPTVGICESQIASCFGFTKRGLIRPTINYNPRQSTYAKPLIMLRKLTGYSTGYIACENDNLSIGVVNYCYSMERIIVGLSYHAKRNYSVAVIHQRLSKTVPYVRSP